MCLYHLRYFGPMNKFVCSMYFLDHSQYDLGKNLKWSGLFWNLSHLRGSVRMAIWNEAVITSCLQTYGDKGISSHFKFTLEQTS